MQPAVYASNPPPSISDLSPFPEAVVILLLAWLGIKLLLALWDHSRHRSRLPVIFMAMALMCSCTTRQRCFRPFGVWHTHPSAEPASVTIWRSGEASLRLDGETLELRR